MKTWFPVGSSRFAYKQLASKAYSSLVCSEVQHLPDFRYRKYYHDYYCCCCHARDYFATFTVQIRMHEARSKA